MVLNGLLFLDNVTLPRRATAVETTLISFHWLPKAATSSLDDRARSAAIRTCILANFAEGVVLSCALLARNKFRECSLAVRNKLVLPNASAAWGFVDSGFIGAHVNRIAIGDVLLLWMSYQPDGAFDF